MNKIPFSTIKVLKDGVTYAVMPIEDTDGNKWDPGDIKTDKPASVAMENALQEYAPEVLKRLNLQTSELEKITVQGVTIQYNKDGQLGLKIHFKLTNEWFNSPLNTHLPMLYSSAEPLEEIEDAEARKPYLTESMIGILKVLSDATEEYLKFTPKEQQLSLFGPTVEAITTQRDGE